MKFNQWSIELLDSISTGICIIDRSYEVVFWNDFMQFYTGIDREEIKGKGIETFFPDFGLPFYRERIDLIFEGWPPLFYSSRLNKLFRSISGETNSSTEYMDVTITSLSETESLDNFALITVKDVTDLNRKLEERNQLYKTAQEEISKRALAEGKLRESESNLRDLNEIKDKILSIIGHDLRSPLASNINGLEAILDNYDNLPDEHRKQLLAMLLEGSRELLDLLEDLLSWARLNSKSSRMQPVAFKIGELIEAELERLGPLAQEKGIKLYAVDLEELFVLADPNMIKTVIRNLVSNAVKFTDRGGEIILSCCLQGKEALVGVRDTGIGMEADLRDKLFKTEELVSTRGTNNEKGSGFGLILAREFVQKNGGRISVESAPGHGSTFQFTLPLSTDQA